MKAKKYLRKSLEDHFGEDLEYDYPKLFKGIIEVMTEFADHKYSLSNESKVRTILNRRIEKLEQEIKEVREFSLNENPYGAEYDNGYNQALENLNDILSVEINKKR